ncbi:uncharacterized protein LOC117792867 [Drosophila innubila]|uniref:uncharacterized protein LOC117792867 n=1 Tax=Drosophila innubila TaxID=198719 RepID=UPI00148D0465|nr:uncharacterized protein LOC117792867 [Drosophila innubila]
MVELVSDDISYKLQDGNHKWLEDLLRAYPLPTAKPQQCRDEFLKELLEPFQPSEPSVSTDESSSEKQVQFGYSAQDLNSSFNIERDLFHYMKKFSYLHLSSTVPSGRETRIVAPDIFKLMKGRQEKVSSAIGYLSVIYNFAVLRDQLRTVHEMWRVSVTVDKSYNMFSWSIQDYITRFNLPNGTYLDITEMELKNQTDCFKFRVDVSEIIRLISALSDDVRNKHDICESSMLLIRDAQTDIEELVTTSQKTTREGYLDAATAAHGISRSADRSRQHSVLLKINYDDFVYPIEARYRIKWAQTQVDQAIMHNDCYIKEMSKELVELTKGYQESQLFWECSQIAFDMEINALRHRISVLDSQYDENMEIAANTRESFQNKLLKAKEELATNRARIPMFHARIAEVQNIMAQREANEINEMHRARLSSRHSKKKSLTNRKSVETKSKAMGKRNY